jgi:type I restriction enzyme S subunit
MTWEKVKLGDAATFINGYPFKPTDWSTRGKEIIRIQNLTKSNGIEANRYEGVLHDKYLVKKGDLLISWSGTLGVYEWDSDDAWLNQHIFKVVFDKAEVDKKYFKFLILSKLHELEQQVHGATMKHITKGKFDSVEIPLPPLHIQEQIADTLDKADALCRKDQELLQKYDELAQSIFYDMFGDPVRNEKRWTTRKLTNCVIGKAGIKAGPFGSSLKKEFYTKAGYKIYGQEQVIADDLNSGDYYISEEKYKELESCKVAAGDVLISMVGTFGKISVVPADFQPGIINPRLVKLTLDKSMLLPDFFKYVFKLPETKKSLNTVSRGGTMDIINAGILKEFTTIIPPILLQESFLRRLVKLNYCSRSIPLHQTNALFSRIMNENFS